MPERTGTIFVVGSLLLHGMVAWAMPQKAPPPEEPPPSSSMVAFTVAPRPEPPQQPEAPEPKEPSQVEPEPEPPPKPPREPAAPKPPRPQQEPEPEPAEPPPEEPEGSPRDAADKPEASSSPTSVDTQQNAIQTVQSSEQGLAVAQPEGDGSGRAPEGAVEGKPEVEKGPRADQGGPPGVDRAALKRAYLRRLTAVLSQDLHYPRAAKRARMEGVVLLSITLEAGGHIADVRIARTSGHGLLDRAALLAVRRRERLPQPPAVLADGRQTHVLRVPKAFRLVD